MYSLHDFRFILNQVLTSLEENELNTIENEHEVQVTLLPLKEDDLIDHDSNEFDNEVTGRFLHFPRCILTTKAETCVVTASLLATACGSPLRPKKKSKKNLIKWTTSIPGSSLSFKPPQIYGPSIYSFLDSSISTPLDAIFKLFSHNLIEEIVPQTIIYAQQRGNLNFSLNLYCLTHEKIKFSF